MLSRLHASALPSARALATARNAATRSQVGYRPRPIFPHFLTPNSTLAGPVCVFGHRVFECLPGAFFALFFRVNAVSEGVYVFQSLVNSRVTLASATLLSVGSIAWYTHLYGSLPFLGQVYASDPAEDGLHPPAYPWPHKGLLDSFDHARYVHHTPSCLHPANLQPVPQHPERLRRLP